MSKSKETDADVCLQAITTSSWTTVGRTAGPQTVLSKQTLPNFRMASQHLLKRFMVWGWGGECIPLLEHTLARNMVQS